METITITAHSELRSVEPDSMPSLRVVLELVARGAPVENERAPLACALALDVSGSMVGEPIEHLIASVDKLTELAGPSDWLAVVAFSDSGAEVAPLTLMDAAGRRLLRSRVHRLEADGHTNAEDGLRKAAALVLEGPAEARRSVVLLSDGAPNVGAVTPSALRDLVKTFRPGVAFSCLGYGPNHQEDVLDAVATAGGGKYQFIAHPTSCRRELAQALGAQGDVVADGIELHLAPADGVEIRRFIGRHEPRFGAGVKLALADMEDGARVLVALDLQLTRPIAADGVLLCVHVTYRTAQTRSPGEARATLAVDVKSGTSEREPEAEALVLVARGEEERHRARELADRGQYAGAAAVLRAFLGEIDACGAFVADDGTELAELRETVLDEAVAFERRPSDEAYSVFRKHTVMSSYDKKSGPAALRRGALSQRFADATAGRFPEAYLVVVSGIYAGVSFRLRETNSIGRTSTAHVVVPSTNVSRRHAEVYALEGEFWVCDLGSTNPTAVNGRQIDTRPHKLKQGDFIRVGDVELRYEQR